MRSIKPHHVTCKYRRGLTHWSLYFVSLGYRIFLESEAATRESVHTVFTSPNVPEWLYVRFYMEDV